eukprot:TRINITY_DN4593_c0_g1_i1.p1 TRINITY_DN4593_c0_g1~~TRINITY_DN4593_c0_g1_i1.p1  ORF type:complete len:264 (+),score=47.78 TRINITY_DN4593_c0_g1_i1:84-875(+)
MQSRIKFIWPHGGKAVFLSGQFNDWATDQPMHKDEDGTFVAWQLLGPGTYQYKFIVDGAWVYDNSKPVQKDLQGNINNVIELVEFETEIKRKISDVYETFYRSSTSTDSECTHIPKMEQFSPEIYIVYAQGWEGSFDVHGGKSWDLKWAVTKQSVLGVIDREPLDNPKQMKELEQALFFAVKNFGHSEQITKFGAHKMMDSLMLYVDAGRLGKYKVLATTRLEGTRYSPTCTLTPQYFIVDASNEQTKPFVWYGTPERVPHTN